MLIQKGGATYILTNKLLTVLYVGATSDLHRRISEHRTGFYPNAFTRRYNCDKLLWYQLLDDIDDAFSREKQIKGGSRQAKINLVKSLNPEWKDLWEEEVRFWEH